MKLLTLQIASLPDRENAVSEIWFGNDQVAEISNEGDGTPIIEIFPAPAGGWSFDLDAFQAILAEAKGNLQKNSHAPTTIQTSARSNLLRSKEVKCQSVPV